MCPICKRRRFNLSTSNVTNMQYISIARHRLTLRSKGQISRSNALPAWVCMSIWLFRFLLFFTLDNNQKTNSLLYQQTIQLLPSVTSWPVLVCPSSYPYIDFLLMPDVIYASRAYATMSVSVCLSVTEVHWSIIANLGFKFRSKFTAHCGRGACGREGRVHRREEWRDHLALC